MDIYNRLYETFGPQYWWPGETTFEIMIGAVLTQNTSWGNVEKAIIELKNQKLLSLENLMKLPLDRLASLIKSCGYYNLKARRLKNFLEFLNRKGGVDEAFEADPFVLRKELLEVKGIGPETADSILLYAGRLPFFVVDAYTKRIFSRHKLIDEKADYVELQKFFMDNLKHDDNLFNEYHALIVKLGKNYCKKKPFCEKCPLKELNVQWQWLKSRRK